MKKVKRLILAAAILVIMTVTLYRYQQKRVVVGHMQNHIQYLLDIKALLPEKYVESNFQQNAEEIFMLIDQCMNEYAAADEIRYRWRIGNDQTTYGTAIELSDLNARLIHLIGMELAEEDAKKLLYVYSDIKNIVDYVERHYGKKEISPYDTIYRNETFDIEVRANLNYED